MGRQMMASIRVIPPAEAACEVDEQLLSNERIHIET